MESILPVIDEIFTSCIFPEKELSNLKTITCQSLKVSVEKSQFLASVNFRKVLFGEKYPYGRQYWEKDIDSVNRNELVSFSNKAINWSTCEIFISGLFKIDNVLSILNKYTKQASSKFFEFDFGLQNFTSSNEKFKYIEKKDALQSSIKVGCLTIDRTSPDYLSLLVLNEILGGFFGSRLMKNIREDKGYTYGIHSSIQTLMKSAYFVISTDVKSENTQDTLLEINKEVELIKSELISTTELNTVISYMLGRFMNSLNTPFALMDKFKTIHYHNLTYDYYNEFSRKLQMLTPLELISIANKYFDQESFSKVVVGTI